MGRITDYRQREHGRSEWSILINCSTAQEASMKLDMRATAIASGLVLGGGVLALEVVHRRGRSARQIALGPTYAVVDGATTGLLFALLYNRLADRPKTATARQQLPKAG